MSINLIKNNTANNYRDIPRKDQESAQLTSITIQRHSISFSSYLLKTGKTGSCFSQQNTTLGLITIYVCIILIHSSTSPVSRSLNCIYSVCLLLLFWSVAVVKTVTHSPGFVIHPPTLTRICSDLTWPHDSRRSRLPCPLIALPQICQSGLLIVYYLEGTWR